MKTSLFKEFERLYASRISEYVIPPRTNTIMRSRISVVCPPGRAARCQAGFWLRKEVAGTVAARAEDARETDGASFTYGKTVSSSLPAAWSFTEVVRL
jgi:hypothetical protein